MVESKAAFARRMGWKNRSTATRYAYAGKIVLTASGMVDVEQSIARLEASKDPDKEGVRQRHARARGGDPKDAADLMVTAKDNGYQQLTKYRAKAEAERGRLLELEREQLEGKLVDAEAVAKRAHQVARAARDAVMSLRYRLDPLLAGETDQAKRDEIWDRETRQICDEISRGVSLPVADGSAQRGSPGTSKAE